MYEFGTCRRPIVVRAVASVEVNGVEHNALVIPHKVVPLLKKSENDNATLFFVIIPVLLETDQRPLVFISDDNSEVFNITSPGEFTNAKANKLSRHAGERKLISMVTDYDDKYKRSMRLLAAHEL